MLDDIFFYIEGRWSHEECKHLSINVLKSAMQNFGALTFFDQAVEHPPSACERYREC